MNGVKKSDRKEAINAIVKISLPAIASMAVETILGFVDTFWVSKLGVEAVSAISASWYLLWVVFSVVDIIAVGLVSLAAYYKGKEDSKELSRTFYTAFYSVLFLSLLLSGFLLTKLFSYAFIFKVSLKERLWIMDYLIVQLVFLPIAGLYYIFSSYYEGLGETPRVFRSSVLVLILNAILDPIFIFSAGLGLKGAALASAVSRTAGVIYLWREVKLRYRGFSSRILLETITIGAPSSIYWLVATGVFIYLNSLASSINPFSVAAMGIGVRYETLPYIISMGISIAASAIVGQSKGAENFERLKDSSNFSLKLITYISIVIGTVFFLFSKTLVSPFLQGEAARIASIYLKISAFSQIFFSLSIVFEGIFIGMGLTAFPLGIAVVVILSRIPLALLHRSLLWMFVVFPVSNFVICLIFYGYFRQSLNKFLTLSTS